MKEHILAFGCEGIAPLLTQTFAPRKMAVKAVPLADYAQTVGALAGAATVCAYSSFSTGRTRILSRIAASRIFCIFSPLRL